MFRVRKSTVKLATIAMLVFLLASVAISGVGAAGGVDIHTSPQTQHTLEIDGVVVGTFDLYNGANYIHISWDPYAFPAGVNGSYRVSVFQDHTPLEAEPTWVEIKINHHWADNPAGTVYDLGPFVESDHLCDSCPSVIAVQPEVFEKNTEGDTSAFTYTLLNVSYSTDVLANLEQTEEILISGVAETKKEPKACVPIAQNEILCGGGVDDDCDGLVDMADPDCFN